MILQIYIKSKKKQSKKFFFNSLFIFDIKKLYIIYFLLFSS